MHYGSPLVDEMIAVLYTHPQVYVDIGGIQWTYPRDAVLLRSKAMLPWESAPTWTAEALLRDLDAVTPKLAEWAESFGEDGPGD